MAKQRALICPYCGKMQPETDQCRSCRGFLDPLSRQATHNAMGPWFIKEEGRGHHPGCSYETFVKLIERGDITRHTIVRGPTTRQFWTIAKRVPCLSHLLGFCHACDASVDPGDHGCHACGVKFGAYLDRNYMGLPEVRPLPWEADVEDDVSQVGPRIDVPDDMRRDWSARGAGAMEERLSSFATDDELAASATFSGAGSASGSVRTGSQVQESAVATAAESAPATQGSSAARQSVSEPAPEPQAVATDFDTGIATRSLQRRLRANTVTIQRLWIALVVSVIANGMLVLGWQAGWFNASAPHSMSAESETADNANVAMDDPATAETRDKPSTSNDGGNDSPTDGTPVGSGKVDEDSGEPAVVYSNDTDESADDAPDQDADAQQSIALTMEQVDALVKSAKDEQRTLKDRIKDYEKVIALLTTLTEKHSDVATELKIAERMIDYEREAERLRLRVFFP